MVFFLHTHLSNYWHFSKVPSSLWKKPLAFSQPLISNCFVFSALVLFAILSYNTSTPALSIYTETNGHFLAKSRSKRIEELEKPGARVFYRGSRVIKISPTSLTFIKHPSISYSRWSRTPSLPVHHFLCQFTVSCSGTFNFYREEWPFLRKIERKTYREIRRTRWSRFYFPTCRIIKTSPTFLTSIKHPLCFHTPWSRTLLRSLTNSKLFLRCSLDFHVEK